LKLNSTISTLLYNRSNEGSDHELEMLKEVLMVNHSISTLDFTGGEFCDATQISNLIRSSLSIKTLDLSSNNFDSNAINSILAAILDIAGQATTGTSSAPPLPPRASSSQLVAIEPSQQQQQHPSLKTLNISNACSLRQGAGCDLVAFLQGNRTVEDITTSCLAPTMLSY
jgi:hypothetical protein